MNYFSLNHKAPTVNFEKATVNGIAPDKGLYFPESLIPLDKLMLETIEFMSNEQIAYEVIRQFVNESIPKKELRKIVEETLNFDFPLVKLAGNSKIIMLIALKTLLVCFHLQANQF